MPSCRFSLLMFELVRTKLKFQPFQTPRPQVEMGNAIMEDIMPVHVIEQLKRHKSSRLSIGGSSATDGEGSRHGASLQNYGAGKRGHNLQLYRKPCGD